MHHALRCLAVASLLSLSACACAQDDYLNHLVFTNSPTPDNDFYTGARAVAPSTLESSDGRLPVETKVFFTPPNALRLQWRSVEGGSWDAEIRTVSFDNRPDGFSRRHCSLSGCYSASHIAAADLPQIQLTDDAHNFTDRLALGRIRRRPYKPSQWKRVQIPLRRFAAESLHAFDPHRSSLRLPRAGRRQRRASHPPPRRNSHRQSHVLQRTKHAPPRRSAHDSAPKPSSATSISSGRRRNPIVSPTTVISRSINDEEFKAIGIQQPGLHRYTDFLGAPGIKVTYKIVVVDKQYRQSALSNPVTAQTRPHVGRRTAHHAPGRVLPLLLGTRLASASPAWPSRACPAIRASSPPAPVDSASWPSSWAWTAASSPTRRALNASHASLVFLRRPSAFTAHGRTFMDGATGHTLPVFGMFDDGGDLVETSFLMQGLLTARQYLRIAAPLVRARPVCPHHPSLGDRGVGLVCAPGRIQRAPLALVTPMVVAHRSRLTGFNETMIAYLLAMASPTHGIPARHLLRRMGQPIARSRAIPRRLVRHCRRPAVRQRQHLRGHQAQRRRGQRRSAVLHPVLLHGRRPALIRDKYTDYFDNNRNIALIDYRYCQQNPGHFKGYGPGVWGLTASLDPFGYSRARAQCRQRQRHHRAHRSARLFPLHSRAIHGRTQILLPHPRRSPCGESTVPPTPSISARTGFHPCTSVSIRRPSS